MSEERTAYLNRTVDLEILRCAGDYPSGGLMRQSPYDMTSGDVSGRITGIDKLAQRYALLLLSGLGTARSRPAQGTNLISGLYRTGVTSRAYMVSIFNTANALAMNQLDAARTAGDPDDEVLSTATLLSLEPGSSSGSVTLRIRLESAAGETYVFVLPV